MKKLFIIALLTPFLATAQTTIKSWELGINAGISSNNTSDGKNIADWNGATRTTNFASKFTVAKTFPHFMIGAEISPTSVAYNANASYLFKTVKVSVSNPAIPIYIDGNYLIGIGKSKIYVGIALGYYFSTTNTNDKNVIYVGNKSAFAVGAQVGYEYFVTKSIAVNANIDFRRVFMAGEGVNSSLIPKNLYYYPITLGIHFKI